MCVCAWACLRACLSVRLIINVNCTNMCYCVFVSWSFLFLGPLGFFFFFFFLAIVYVGLLSYKHRNFHLTCVLGLNINTYNFVYIHFLSLHFLLLL